MSEDAEKEKWQYALERRWEPAVARLKSEIAERRRNLDRITPLVPRLAKRPTIPGVAVELVLIAVDKVEQGRLEGEIRELEARLAPLERELEKARRLKNEARINHGVSARAYAENGCTGLP